MTVKVLALDLERTLISDALSALPRPGLADFLDFCHARFDRVALFTCVERADALEILARLAEDGHVPPALLDRLEYVEWAGEHKDFVFIPDALPDQVILVDDDPSWVRPDQRHRLITAAGFDGGKDDELSRIRAALERWLDRPGDESG